ncbi:MAG: hypothetical protein ABIU29_12510 [Chthoniobacterales bacterium]
MKTTIQKYLLCLRLGVVAAGLSLLASCASTGGHANLDRLSKPTMERPVVAVLPFGTPNYQSLAQNDRMVRDFERSYFSARLVRALKGTSGIGVAYFSPNETPACDYNVKGEIKKSDGKMTVVDVEVKSADGRSMWKKSFNVNTTSEEFKHQPDPSGRLWPQIAAAISETKQQSGDFAVARTIGYSGQKDAAVTDKRALMSNEAAGVERRQLLEPATKLLAARAALPNAGLLYVKWQRESTPLVEQRSGEKTAVVMSGITTFLGGVAAGVGAASGNSFATVAGAQVMTTASNNAAISEAKIVEIDKVLATTAQSLVLPPGQPLLVRLFDKVYTFTGSPDKQQTDLRRVVAGEIAKLPM